nr:ABC transporter ATP-binding protein [uncultured Arsenicibacter sp.]
MPIAIKAENISKAYQLGEIGTGTLSRDLERWVARIRGKEDPFLKIGETNDRTKKGSSDIVWSLKDINFEIEQGDAVGIIGRNGAGKSTLLKVLSRVTSPTTGRITGKGRIASLLEVGTGFHPELTGRENIYLNGAILGMRKREIARKFDEIVDFAGVERYIDTPVKRYSSGMYVRLAFAVAAHLESEILIVDEVLAVGDAEFQQKCLGKMGEVSKGEGRTVLFVSHNMGSISSICNRGVLLKKGMISEVGQINTVINEYNKQMLRTDNSELENSNEEVALRKIEIKNTEGEYLVSNCKCIAEIEIYSKKYIEDVVVGVGFNDNMNTRILTIFSKHFGKYYKINPGINILRCEIEQLPLKPSKYFTEVYVGTAYEQISHYNCGLNIEVLEVKNQDMPDHTQGYIVVKQNWN